VRKREALDELDIERLDEAHVGNRGVEARRRLERRLQHRAESKDRDRFPSRRTSPLPIGSARISGSIATPGPLPRG
jgi:hypothetical protein